MNPALNMACEPTPDMPRVLGQTIYVLGDEAGNVIVDEDENEIAEN